MFLSGLCLKMLVAAYHRQYCSRPFYLKCACNHKQTFGDSTSVLLAEADRFTPNKWTVPNKHLHFLHTFVIIMKKNSSFLKAAILQGRNSPPVHIGEHCITLKWRHKRWYLLWLYPRILSAECTLCTVCHSIPLITDKWLTEPNTF